MSNYCKMSGLKTIEDFRAHIKELGIKLTRSNIREAVRNRLWDKVSNTKDALSATAGAFCLWKAGTVCRRFPK